MSTERFMLIRCNDCGTSCDPVETFEMPERELRSDLKKRLGWLMYRTERGWRDVCPQCQQGKAGK